MGQEKREPAMSRTAGSAAGSFWFAGGLFTISFARLVWKILLGLVVWPYFLGEAARR